MPRKLSRRVSGPPPDFDSPIEIEPSQGGGADDSVNRLLSQFDSGEVMVKVYEQIPGGAERYLYNITQPTPEKCSEESVRMQNKGRGGNFKLCFLVDGELRVSQTLSIADSPDLEKTSALAPSSNDPTLQLLLGKIAALEMQLQARSNIQREPILDLVQAMAQIQALQPPKPEMGIDTIMKCIELGKSLSGDGGSDWGSIVKDVIKEVGPAIAPLLAGAMRQPGPSFGELPAGGSTAMMEEQILKQGIEYLKKKCKMGANPELYGAMVADNADEVPYSRLVDMACTQSFDAFTAIDQELAGPPYRPFFESIYNYIRSEFASPDSVADHTGGDGGNKNDIASDGGSDKGRGA